MGVEYLIRYWRAHPESRPKRLLRGLTRFWLLVAALLLVGQIRGADDPLFAAGMALKGAAMPVAVGVLWMLRRRDDA